MQVRHYSLILLILCCLGITLPDPPADVPAAPASTAVHRATCDVPGVPPVCAARVAVTAGWNLISVPCQQADMSPTALFGTNLLGDVFGHDPGTGYSTAATLVPGRGYWALFQADTTYTLTGTAAPTTTATVAAGWNLVGPMHMGILPDDVTAAGSAVLAPYYAYTDGLFAPATALEPGQGYWVLTDAGGTLDFANTSTATYQIDFEATWSATTHPTDFPVNAHFSRLFGGTHNAAVSFWDVDSLATDGIERMAEMGARDSLNAEIVRAIEAGTACAYVLGGNVNPSPGTMVPALLEVDTDFPLVTLVSMVAPSPDWFVGTTGLTLFEQGAWVAQKAVTLYAYDAGTDSGTTYSAPNEDTQPPDPITQIATSPFEVGGNVVPVGTLTLTLQ